jgi:hypothetical protein
MSAVTEGVVPLSYTVYPVPHVSLVIWRQSKQKTNNNSKIVWAIKRLD